jgi:hypothetical protein
MSGATSLSVGPLTFTRFSAPPRAGLGMALLYFCGWVMVALLRLCWWTAKALLMAAVLLVAVLACWLPRQRRSAPISAMATSALDNS